MSKILALSILVINLMGPWSVMAEAHVIKKYFPNAEKVGEDRLTYLFWDIYDASLYSSNGIFSENEPFALRLDYLRSLKGIKIAERSIKEMEQQGFDDEAKLSLWLKQMVDIFPNVKEGDTVTGIKNQDGESVFYLNEEYIGTIEDPEFAETFFGIWLSPKTSEPAMRKKLLGL